MRGGDRRGETPSTVKIADWAPDVCFYSASPLKWGSFDSGFVSHDRRYSLTSTRRSRESCRAAGGESTRSTVLCVPSGYRSSAQIEMAHPEAVRSAATSDSRRPSRASKSLDDGIGFFGIPLDSCGLRLSQALRAPPAAAGGAPYSSRATLRTPPSSPTVQLAVMVHRGRSRVRGRRA